MAAGEADRRTAVGAVAVVLGLLALLAAWVVAGGPGPAPLSRELPRGELAQRPAAGTATPGATPGPTAGAAGWDPAALAAGAPLRCGDRRAITHLLEQGDITGDGIGDVVVAVRCDAGAGSPPDGVYARAGPAESSRLLSVLLEPSRQVLVDRVSVSAGRVVVTGTGYSTSSVPRCCPDLTVREEWVWTGSGLVRAG